MGFTGIILVINDRRIHVVLVMIPVTGISESFLFMMIGEEVST